jgi:DNA-binding MarR family transcriptional regulator
MSQRELANRLGVEQATVAVALRRLEAAGFVSRRPAPEDARVRLTLLTEDGREALSHIDRAWREAEKVLTDALSPQELQALRTLLHKVSYR